MKPFPLLPLVVLVFAVAYACTDSTAPDNSPSLLIKDATPARLGDPPPPPVDAAIIITVSSHIFLIGSFEGVYFSNGSTIESAVAAAEVGDEALTFDGTAWLRLNNRQSDAFETTASANARFMRTDAKVSGHGTLVINDHEVVITEVTSFQANPDCGLTGEPCAIITFDATVDGEPGHHGTATAFDSDVCTIVPGEGQDEFDCPDEETPPDLTVSQFSISPTSPTTADRVVYTIVVSNSGETDAPASEGTLTEGYSRTVDGSPQVGGSVESGFAVPAVPAGGSTTLTLTRGPFFVASWGATFTVNTGAVPVVESSGLNNSLSVSFRVTSVID